MIVSAVLTFLVYGALVLQRYSALDPAVAASTETMLRWSATAMLVFEKQSYSPSLELAFRIARAFGTDVESVFHFEETQEEDV